MNVEEKLKELILANYKSIRAFTVAASIPYSTVDNIFKRGIGGTAVTTVVRICDLLGITVEGITHGIIEPKENSAQLTPTQAKLLDSFDQLNEEGQTKVMDYAEVMSLMATFSLRMRRDRIRSSSSWLGCSSQE